MKIRTFLLIFAVFVFATPSAAKIYKYHDTEGNIHFTDDISRVPVDQRPLEDTAVPALDETPDTSAEPEDATVETGAEAEAEAPSPYAIETEEEPEEELPPDTGDWIAEEQLSLRREYKEIMTEKEAIENLKQKEADINEINQRVIKNNERIKAYQDRLAVYNEKVKKYNQMLVEKQSQQSP